MARDKPKQRRATPVTGRYTPTARNLAFKKAAQERRVENAEIAQQQREAKKAKLAAVIAQAEAATARAQAAKRAAEQAAQPTTAAPEGDAPAEVSAVAQSDTEPPTD